MKRVNLTLCFFFVLAHSFCQQINVLNLSRKAQFFTETNSFQSDSFFRLRNEVFYNKPGKIDEEFSHILQILIPSNSIRVNKTFDLTKDSSTIRGVYDWQSIWNWRQEASIVTGTFAVLSWNAKEVRLRLNIRVQDLSHDRTYYYKGERKFAKLK